jgi:hypothetical protein
VHGIRCDPIGKTTAKELESLALRITISAKVFTEIPANFAAPKLTIENVGAGLLIPVCGAGWKVEPALHLEPSMCFDCHATAPHPSPLFVRVSLHGVLYREIQ